MTDRRTVLAMLGLAPASAVGMESFLEPLDKGEEPALVTSYAATNAMVAGALRNLAASIESGDAMVESLNMDSSLEPQQFPQHTLRVKFAYKILDYKIT